MWVQRPSRRPAPTATLGRMGARRSPVAAALLAAVVGLLAACSAGGDAEGADGVTTAVTASGPAPATSTAGGEPAGTRTLDVDGRAFRLHVPPGYDGSTPAPLLVGLHGYTSNSAELDAYFGLTAAADERGFLLALPDGLVNPQGEQYWNAVEGGCCDFYRTRVDDSGYLSRLVDEVRSSYAVDTVAVIGHSNGGYLAHRFACEHSDQVDAIASLAGPLASDTSVCAPSEPVRVLHLHGDADETVPYGGSAAQSSASAVDTARRWAELDGCAATPEAGPALDLEARLPGAETAVSRYADGCRDGSRVELWTIAGGRHVPTWTDTATAPILDFLLG